MKFFAGAPNEVTSVDHPAAAIRATGTGIRALLRDTALQVSTLNQGGTIRSVPALRERCVELIAEFATALEQRGVPPDVQEDAIYAQCGLLDETILRHLPPGEKHQWDAQPLQVERFGKHDAGDYVFARLGARMRETTPNVDLLESYAVVLALGFMGRFAREGEAKRHALMVSLNALLARLRPGVPQKLIVERGSMRLTDWFHRLSPWTIVSVGCVIAALVYFGWSRALDNQLAALLVPLAEAKP